MVCKRLLFTFLAILFVGVGCVSAQSGELQQPVKKATVLALRSNLLVPGLNVGAVLPLGNKFSFAADYYYPWFESKKNRHCLQLLGVSAEFRYWFGRERSYDRRLRGHSLAVYGSAGYYDLEYNFEGTQGEYVNTGLDYTYALGLGKKKRVHLEFTLAVGYIHSEGRPYYVLADYGPLFKENHDMVFDYVGPTKAAVSIVVPIFKRRMK